MEAEASVEALSHHSRVVPGSRARGRPGAGEAGEAGASFGTTEVTSQLTLTVLRRR